MAKRMSSRQNFKNWIEKNKVYIAYQPIVEIATSHIFAYEALTRSRKLRKRGPEKLFQHAYEHGFVPLLDLYCIERALAALPHLDRGQRLFINVEPMTMGTVFRKGEKIDQLLSQTPLRKNVVFELTEGMKVNSLERVRKGVQLLKKCQCQLALDDIRGIGLKLIELFRYKPRYVKIDMSLIQGLQKSTFHQRMLQALVSLSRTHNAELVAEGIENSRNLRLVSKFRIRYAQGAYYSLAKRPLIKSLKHSK